MRERSERVRQPTVWLSQPGLEASASTEGSNRASLSLSPVEAALPFLKSNSLLLSAWVSASRILRTEQVGR